jgi:hypothetical protein
LLKANRERQISLPITVCASIRIAPMADQTNLGVAWLAAM